VFFLIGFRNRIYVLLEWFWAYLTRERSARLITGDAAELKDALHFLNAEPAVVAAEPITTEKTRAGKAQA